MPLDLYYNRVSPPCRAVMLTVKQLGLEVNVIRVDYDEGTNMTPEYLKMKPTHTIPTINDNGFALWESRSIMQYLCNKYAPDNDLYPSDPKQRALVDRWLQFDMTIFSTFVECFGLKHIFGINPSEDKIKASEDIMKLMDQLVGDNKYLANNQLTIADLALVVSTSLYAREKELGELPNVNTWFTNLVSELPYFDEVCNIPVEEIGDYLNKLKNHFMRIRQNES